MTKATVHGAGPLRGDRNVGHYPNLISLFLSGVQKRGDDDFLVSKSSGEWQSISWNACRTQVAALAGALRRMGLEPGDRVMLLSENRPEWCIADLAIMAAGLVTVPAYTTNLPDDHRHIMENSEARCAIVSGDKLTKNLLPAIQSAGCVEHLITIEPCRLAQTGQFDLHAWNDLIEPQAGDIEALEKAAETLARKDMACIIYTSGTGGTPRGVMTSHGAILHNAEGAGDILLNDFAASNERFLSFLPLSHAYEHTGGQYLPIAMGAEIYYSEGLDKLAANIEETSPTVMVVVPRLFEVLRARIIKGIVKQGGLAPKLLREALALGKRAQEGKPHLTDPLRKLVLDRLFLSKIRARFGGRMKAMVSGGAPLNPEIGRFFSALGLMVLQGYGQTEAGPVISCNRPRAGVRMETVGPPLKNTQVRIADDGEILVQGELVMLGYWRNLPDTRRTLKDDWLHTGDIGHLDDAGRIVITDRKKDIIVNDKGDNVAPQRVEGRLTLEPEIAQAMVYGDKRP